jgi:hypothetical protein
MIFNIAKEDVGKYIFALGVVIIASYFANKIKAKFDNKERDDYEMVKQYLLNDSPLYGYNKPKLWIHTKYELNARKWRDFYSRTTTDLNQPYIHQTIRSIIEHCGNDFHICLIDDDSFGKLIPTWDADLLGMAEPAKSHFRDYGLTQLVYYYGGMIVPNSFLCLKNLKPLYDSGVGIGRGINPAVGSGDGVFICEGLNRGMNKLGDKRLTFVPDIYMMGANKNNDVIKSLAEHIRGIAANPHFTGEPDFKGDISQWCVATVKRGYMTLVGGELVGIKNRRTSQPILLEDLLDEGYLEISPEAYGIYIPEDEVLKRPKYQWFAVMPVEQILASKMMIAKYMKISMVNLEGLRNVGGTVRGANGQTISISSL